MDNRQTDGQTRDRQASLCEGEAGLVVNLEHLLDGVDVRRRPQVQTQVVLVGRPHDLLHEEGGEDVEKESVYVTYMYVNVSRSGISTSNRVNSV